jgi:hypothetical protein
MQCGSGQDTLGGRDGENGRCGDHRRRLMGASIAFNLARRGISNVAVLKKNFIAPGATGKSSACVR